MIGRSGATIQYVGDGRVLKKGGTTDLAGQATMLEEMGEQVCPSVIRRAQDGYVMEELEELSAAERDDYQVLIVKVLNALHAHVWCRPAPPYQTDWRNGVTDWIKRHALWIDRELFHELYPAPESLDVSYTHGDPTLANVMIGEGADPHGRRVMLIDPVPPRRNVPPARTMDLARLMQSAAGWEHALDPERWRRPPSERLFSTILGIDSITTQRRIFFWAAYNCARIQHHDFDRDSVHWAQVWGPIFLRNARK